MSQQDTAEQTATEQIAAGTEQFVERLFASASGAIDVYTVYVGDRLGFYDALADAAPLTASELAERTDTRERYVREWLEQQAVAGILAVDDESAPAEERRFSLPPGHAEPLTDPDSLAYVAPLAQAFVGAASPIEDVVEAFRTGGGVPFEAYGRDLHEGQGRMNRPLFLRLLGEEWLPTISDVHERLQREGARVADIGCGHGYSAIGIAQSYPNVGVDGFDADEASVAAARANVAEAGLSDRVSVHHRDAGDASIEGAYDLVTAFECIHDMSDPVGALTTMRRLAGPEGTVLVMDERVADEFRTGEESFDWFFYGFSVLHCLPVGMADEPSAATGTVMRTETLRSYADDAGYSAFEVLPIENDSFRFYRLDP